MKNKFIVVVFLLIVIIVVGVKLTQRDEIKYVIKQEINISKEGSYHFAFKNMEKGFYEVGLIINGFKYEFDKKNKSISGKYKTKLNMEINFYYGRELMSSSKSMAFDPFYAQDFAGLILTAYRCPEEMPMNKQLDCEVIIKSTDPELINYKPVYFFIQKDVYK